ncbi:acyl-CoA/acyl-ACP dehydrogenase [Pseudomonadales bacterium]|jgi:acyl-CoA dehydrogenase|nr:acyl-CoA/acyl-ACP dehydrogenase [Pseudomonadales bacterium]MDA8881030.1 acyl-CoA/acyl-ACP dehydrogenase [Pseudomonadales bacterium]|tara:strand:+ start:645 stop:1811 length:1167 start_codon:yes stop_codon:yes gene_type:complete
MDMRLTEQQQAISDNVAKVCSEFDDGYWSGCEADERFPQEFVSAMAAGGWLGITMPEAYGGSALGVTEAALMMHAVSKSGGGQAASSSVHINLFGPHPIVVMGTDEQKQRMLPPIIRGEHKVAFGVTEPNAGSDTTSIETFAEKVEGGYRVNGRKMWTSTAQEAQKIMLLARTQRKDEVAKRTEGLTLFFTDLNRDHIELQRIPKMGRAAVDSNATFIDDLFIPEQDRIGEEGRGFYYLLHSLNPERILVAAAAIGLGQDAISRASRYARERVVFGRPIGQNQSIQHPLAECWAHLEAAYCLTLRAASLYDCGEPCGAEANAAKFLGGQAGFNAATQAVLTHGGMGYAKEYQVERLLRESLISRIGPVSEQMVLCFLGEQVLDLPKSY